MEQLAEKSFESDFNYTQSKFMFKFTTSFFSILSKIQEGVLCTVPLQRPTPGTSTVKEKGPTCVHADKVCPYSAHTVCPRSKSETKKEMGVCVSSITEISSIFGLLQLWPLLQCL